MADCDNSALRSQTQVELQPLSATNSVGRPRAIDESDV